VARYGKEFKDRAVARLLPPESAAITADCRMRRRAPCCSGLSMPRALF
jgi:hypothetical protein